jgi:hypothetical protein
MSEVTYYVALPFVATDDGIAPGEPVECLSSNAAIMRAEPCHARKVTPERSRLVALATLPRAISATLR